MIKPRRSVSVLALATFGALYACSGTTVGSGGPGGSASATGTVGGMTLSVASQIGSNSAGDSSSSCDSLPDGGEMCTSSSSQGVGVILTNRAAATCGLLQSAAPDTNFANFAYLELAVLSATGTVGAGTYPISGNESGASAEFATSSATCVESNPVTATSGSITLTEVSATTLVGTYDVTFGTQGSFSGSFDASICTLPDGGISSGGSTACVQ